jgi:hypothetical protein
VRNDRFFVSVFVKGFVSNSANIRVACVIIMPLLIAYWGAEVLFSAIGVLLCGSVLVLPDFDLIPPVRPQSLISNEGMKGLW